MFNNYAKSELELMVGEDENILWQGKPDKKCYILEGIFNPFLFIAIIWLLVDSSFFAVFALAFSGEKIATEFLFLPILFVLLHLTPVWLYIGGAIFLFRRYQHTEYIVTDKGIYISGGLFSYTCNMKPFAELSRVNIHRGIIDQIIGVGDVVIETNSPSNVSVNGTPVPLAYTISSIRDYRGVYEIIKKLQEDIYTDTMYPNALRPENNPGYRTKYTGMD